MIASSLSSSLHSPTRHERACSQAIVEFLEAIAIFFVYYALGDWWMNFQVLFQWFVRYKCVFFLWGLSRPLLLELIIILIITIRRRRRRRGRSRSSTFGFVISKLQATFVGKFVYEFAWRQLEFCIRKIMISIYELEPVCSWYKVIGTREQTLLSLCLGYIRLKNVRASYCLTN